MRRRIAERNGRQNRRNPKLNDKVAAGQKVLIKRNTFGEVVAEYVSGVDGEVGAIRTDVTSEPGNVLMFILFNRAPSGGQGGYPE